MSRSSAASPQPSSAIWLRLFSQSSDLRTPACSRFGEPSHQPVLRLLTALKAIESLLRPDFPYAAVNRNFVRTPHGKAQEGARVPADRPCKRLGGKVLPLLTSVRREAEQLEQRRRHARSIHLAGQRGRPTSRTYLRHRRQRGGFPSARGCEREIAPRRPPAHLSRPTEGPSRPPTQRSRPMEGPAEPSVPPSEPTKGPADPAVPPSEPTVGPADPSAQRSRPTVGPADPSVPPSEPTKGPAEPKEGPAGPSVPPSEPTEGPAGPAVPSSEPTEGPADPAVPPSEPTVSPADPSAQRSRPTVGPADPSAQQSRPTVGQAGPTARRSRPTVGQAGPTALPRR